MVQPDFASRKAQAELSPSPTAALDAFLDNQHQSYFEEVYKNEAACLCVLRLLPPVCRHIILHYLWSHHPVKAGDLRALVRMDPMAPLTQVEEVIRPAMRRKIFPRLDYQQAKRSNQAPMNDVFKKGLRNALTGSGSSNSFGVPYELGSDDEIPSGPELVQYGEDVWESILKYMVSSGLERGMTAARPQPQVLQLLYTSGLMTDLRSDVSGQRPSLDRLTITSKGFQFLLEDRQTQLWQILMFYLASFEASPSTTSRLRIANGQARGASSAPVLSLFFSLACMQLGQPYSVSESFPHSASALDDIESYGFIYRPMDPATGERADHFFPTHLATSLCSGDVSTQKDEGDDKRFLILETNYKIYAYTSNELEIAILNLFVDIRIRYQNLVVGKLDRQHVKAAMEKGISAYQIIAYLQSHAHPQMYNSPPPLLHTTIVDQLHLWDKERNRLRTEEAEMLQFNSKDLFEDTEAEAKRYDGLLHSLPKEKILFVDPKIKDAIRAFIRDQQSKLDAF